MNISHKHDYYRRSKIKRAYRKKSDTQDCYINLAHAIVRQAVNDYKSADPLKGRTRRKEIEKFLFSNWCFALCGLEKGVWEAFIKEYK